MKKEQMNIKTWRARTCFHEKRCAWYIAATGDFWVSRIMQYDLRMLWKKNKWILKLILENHSLLDKFIVEQAKLEETKQFSLIS
jgi:hypothetical protein